MGGKEPTATYNYTDYTLVQAFTRRSDGPLRFRTSGRHEVVGSVRAGTGPEWCVVVHVLKN